MEASRAMRRAKPSGVEQRSSCAINMPGVFAQGAEKAACAIFIKLKQIIMSYN
jgi:hypothetical protein